MNCFKDKKDGALVELSLLGNEKAYEAILSLKATKEFAEFDIGLKKVTIAFCLWFEKKDMQDNMISEKEVLQCLAEWENQI